MVTRTKAQSAKAQSVKADIPTQHTEHLYTESLGITLPTPRRVFVATFVGILTAMAAGYAIGTLVDIVVVAALVYTTSTFLATCIWIVGIVLAIMAASRLGQAAAMFVLGYKPGAFADAGAVLRDASRRKVSLVRDWFKPVDSIAV